MEVMTDDGLERLRRKLQDDGPDINQTIREHAERLQSVYDKRTAGAYTFNGLLMDFLGAALNKSGTPREQAETLRVLVPQEVWLEVEAITYEDSVTRLREGIAELKKRKG